MPPLSALRPLNEAEQRAAFFKNPLQNPHFTYRSPEAAANSLSKYAGRLPEDSVLLELAECVLEAVLRDYGSEEAYQECVWGEKLNYGQVDEECAAYIRRNPSLRGKVNAS